MTHSKAVSNKTFEIIKYKNTNRQFAKIYWTDICLSKKYESISLLISNLCNVFKIKNLKFNVIITNLDYSLDLKNKCENLNIVKINIISLSKDKINKFILDNKISLIIFNEDNYKRYDKINCVNKIIICKRKDVFIDNVKYKNYTLIDSIL